MSLIPESDLILRKELHDPIMEGSLPSWLTTSTSTNGTVTVNDASVGGGFWELDAPSGGENAKVISDGQLSFDISEYDAIAVESELSISTLDSDGSMVAGLNSASSSGEARINGAPPRTVNVNDGSTDINEGNQYRYEQGDRHREEIRVLIPDGKTVAELDGHISEAIEALPPTGENYNLIWAAVGPLTVRVHSVSVKFYDVLTA